MDSSIFLPCFFSPSFLVFLCGGEGAGLGEEAEGGGGGSLETNIFTIPEKKELDCCAWGRKDKKPRKNPLNVNEFIIFFNYQFGGVKK